MSVCGRKSQAKENLKENIALRNPALKHSLRKWALAGIAVFVLPCLSPSGCYNRRDAIYPYLEETNLFLPFWELKLRLWVAMATFFIHVTLSCHLPKSLPDSLTLRIGVPLYTLGSGAKFKSQHSLSSLI